jgi:ABC-2 type transport system permease protein
MMALFLMELVFLAIGILLGCAMKRYRRAGSVAVTLLLGTFFLSVISTMNKDLDFLKYVSPFRYFDAGLMLREARLDPLFVGLALVIVVVSMAGAYVTYARRDLYI